MKKRIVIDISDEGEIRIETQGFTGKACLEESQFLKDILGNEIHRSLIPAAYVRNKQKVKKHLLLCG